MKKAIRYSLILIFACIIILIAGIYVRGDGNISRFVLGVTTNKPSLDEDPQVISKIVLVSDIESDFSILELFINEIKPIEFDAIFLLGDITTLGTEDDMKKIDDIISGIKQKTYAVPGDRDLWKSDLENYNKYFNEDYHINELAGQTFLFINNADEYKGVSDEQYRFIEENIKSADFIVLHNPIYFEGSIISSFFHKGMGQYSVEVETQRKKLLELVQQSNVRAVFAGDMHMFTEQTDIKDPSLNHYTIGALNSDRSIDAPSYAILEILSNGQFRVTKKYFNR